MSSGFGVKGTVGRCYPFWNKFESCMVESEDKTSCRDFRDDYVECLHHAKEYKQVKEMKEAMKIAKEGGGAGGQTGGHGGHH
jgi:NADH dehydrogenase (ubiquinone) Fe-S protein 5